MKVVIITYYWPPSGGSGVQRWLKFVKYLRNFDIEPVVFTVDNPNYPITDESLLTEIPKNIEIIKVPIWEPNNFLSIFKKNKTSESAGFLNPNPTFVGKMLQYVRANYFIPDARKFWVKPSTTYLEKYVLENKIDAFITTGPPHSLHLIGLHLKQKLNVKWIADFRDPWTAIDYFHQLPLTEKSKKKHKLLEKNVLGKADAVLVVGKTMKENFKHFNKNIHVITNGFDDEISEVKSTLDSKFSITHIGLMNDDRNPVILWEVLHQICEENEVFKEDLLIRIIGKTAESVDQNLSKFHKKNIEKIAYLNHVDVKEYQHKSQILLLAINKVPSAKGILTGKIFEYLQAKRPILAIGPTDGDAAEIIRNTNAGFAIDFDDEIELKSVILKLYNHYKAGNLAVNSLNINQYHRKELTKDLATIIKNL